MVLVPHDGPTSKADCLNQMISDIFMFEAEHQMQFAGMVMHDSEDLIHPLELKLFNARRHLRLRAVAGVFVLASDQAP